MFKQVYKHNHLNQITNSKSCLETEQIITKDIISKTERGYWKKSRNIIKRTGKRRKPT